MGPAALALGPNAVHPYTLRNRRVVNYSFTFTRNLSINDVGKCVTGDDVARASLPAQGDIARDGDATEAAGLRGVTPASCSLWPWRPNPLKNA